MWVSNWSRCFISSLNMSRCFISSLNMSVSNSIINSNSIFSLIIAFSQNKQKQKMPISEENPSISLTCEAPKIWPAPLLAHLSAACHFYTCSFQSRRTCWSSNTTQSHMAFCLLLGLDSGITWSEGPPLGTLSEQDAPVPSDAWPSLLSHHYTHRLHVPCLYACLFSIEYLPH